VLGVVVLDGAALADGLEGVHVLSDDGLWLPVTADRGGEATLWATDGRMQGGSGDPLPTGLLLLGAK